MCFPSGQESTCNAGDAGEAGSIPGSGRSLEEGTPTHSSILAQRIPWTEEPGRYGPWDSKESDMTEATEMLTHSSAQYLPRIIQKEDEVRHLGRMFVTHKTSCVRLPN